MAKQRLFPEQKDEPEDTRSPHKRFTEFASRIMQVPKTAIDEREQQRESSRDD